MNALAKLHSRAVHHAISLFGTLGNLLNPLLFALLGAAWLRATPERASNTIIGFWSRVLLSCLAAWLLVHPGKFGVRLHNFDPSSHTAFFLVPAVGLCVLHAKWTRPIITLGIFYALFMIALRFHTFAEVALTTLFVLPVVWLCHRIGKKSARVINSDA